MSDSDSRRLTVPSRRRRHSSPKPALSGSNHLTDEALDLIASLSRAHLSSRDYCSTPDSTADDKFRTDMSPDS